MHKEQESKKSNKILKVSSLGGIVLAFSAIMFGSTDREDNNVYRPSIVITPSISDLDKPNVEVRKMPTLDPRNLLGPDSLLSRPPTESPAEIPAATPTETTSLELKLDRISSLISDLSIILPRAVEPLTPAEEQNITDILSRYFNLKITAELDGKRLDRNYGIIGKEQHLPRYPGDSIDTHFDNEEDVRQFMQVDMSSNLGAWGYFAPSRAQMTKQDSEREKYYIAVQTFLSPGFNEHVAEYYNFFKYRKILVVNPQNGKAVVAVIGDSGPATWTGKQIGGSPEVMSYLERLDGAERGPVLYFFVDDPQDKVPLGPITTQ